MNETADTFNMLGDTPLEQIASSLAMMAPIVESCAQKAWRDEVRFTVASNLILLSRQIRHLSESCDIVNRNTGEIVMAKK